MFTGLYRIADTVFEVNSLYEEVQQLCTDYSTTDEKEMSITISPFDIEQEAAYSRKNRQVESLPPYEYSPSYLETLAVYRKTANLLIPRNTILFHGSSIAVDGQAYLFTAKSGTGKSTHTAIWRKLLGSKAIMINDDKPLIHIQDGKVTIYGTPWNGKHHLGNNISAPLKAICWLTRSEKNHISTVSPQEMCLTLLHQAYKPDEPQLLVQSLALINQLSASVELYKLGCNMEIEAAEMSYKEMSKAQ